MKIAAISTVTKPKTEVPMKNKGHFQNQHHRISQEHLSLCRPLSEVAYCMDSYIIFKFWGRKYAHNRPFLGKLNKSHFLVCNQPIHLTSYL